MKKYYLSGFEPLKRELLVFKVVRNSRADVIELGSTLGLDDIVCFDWTDADDARWPSFQTIGAGVHLSILP